jgi:hypothetical protein
MNKEQGKRISNKEQGILNDEVSGPPYFGAQVPCSIFLVPCSLFIRGKQFFFHQLANDMTRHDMAFLDAWCIG